MSTITATNLHGDTIRKTGGSLGVDIRVKNTSVYESDGGTSVTQNLVQGLAKYWVNYNGQSTVSVRDSFNHASLTDRGTGDYTLGFTNNFASNDYCPQFAGLRGATDENYDAHPSFISGSEDTALTTSTLLTSTCYNNSVQADMLQNYVNIDGDLA